MTQAPSVYKRLGERGEPEPREARCQEKKPLVVEKYRLRNSWIHPARTEKKRIKMSEIKPRSVFEAFRKQPKHFGVTIRAKLCGRITLCAAFMRAGTQVERPGSTRRGYVRHLVRLLSKPPELNEESARIKTKKKKKKSPLKAKGILITGARKREKEEKEKPHNSEQFFPKSLREITCNFGAQNTQPQPLN